MNITYRNIVASDYTIENLDGEILICSTDTYNSNWKIQNFNFTDTPNNTPKVFLELANANTPEKALKFCQKFGALVNPYLLLPNFSAFRSADILKDVFADYNSQKSSNNKGFHSTEGSNDTFSYQYDYIIYSHFKSYQLTMHSLLELYRLLASNKEDSNTLMHLLDKCLSLIYNPFFTDRITLEYRDAFDDSTLSELFKLYPLCLICLTMETNSGNLLQALEYSLSLQPTLKDYFSFLQRVVPVYTKYNSPEKPFYFPRDFLINNRKEIINFAKKTYSDFLSFELHDSHTMAFYPYDPQSSSWYAPSLANAIFIYFNYDCNGSYDILRCANPKCTKLFFCPRSRTNKIYCTPECAHRVANNRYKHKNK